jgi:ribose 5-phosphate isomerase B
MHTPDEATSFVRTFLATEFEGGRHQRRIDMLTAYEQTGEPPALPEE